MGESMRRLSEFLLLLAMLAACCVVPAGAAPEPFGAWRWTETRLSSDESITPDTAGYARALVFNEDMSLDEYRDGEILHTGTFSFYDYWWDMGMGGMELFFIIELALPDFEESYSYDIDSESVLCMCSGTHPVSGFPWYPCEVFVQDDSVPTTPFSWGGLKARYR